MLPYLTLATVRGPAPSGQVATETIDSVVANYGATIASERMRGNVYFVTTLAALGAAIFYRYKASVGQETPRRGHERAASRPLPAPRSTSRDVYADEGDAAYASTPSRGRRV